MNTFFLKAVKPFNLVFFMATRLVDVCLQAAGTSLIIHGMLIYIHHAGTHMQIHREEKFIDGHSWVSVDLFMTKME